MNNKIKLILFFLCTTAITSNAQWTGSTISTNTSSDVNIKTTLNQGNLTIFRDANTIPNLGGTTYTYPKPALSILSYNDCMIQASTINSSPTNAPQADFEIMRATHNFGGGSNCIFLGYNTPVFTIGGDCQMKVGGARKPYFSNAIYGSNYLDNNTLFKGKIRLTNNSATIASSSAFDIFTFPYSFSVDNGNSRFLGKVQIGNLIPITTYTNYALSVDGDIVCKKQIVQTSDWADYVFANTYKLQPLNEVAEFININHHLPNMPSEADVVNNGQDVGEIQKMQQAKIEELTLYIIQLKQEMDEVKKLIIKQ